MIGAVVDVLDTISCQICQCYNEKQVELKSKDFNLILQNLTSISMKYKLILNENLPAHFIWSYIPSRCAIFGPLSIKRYIPTTYQVRLTRYNEEGEIKSNLIQLQVTLRAKDDIILQRNLNEGSSILQIEYKFDQSITCKWVIFNIKISSRVIGGCPFQVDIEQ